MCIGGRPGHSFDLFSHRTHFSDTLIALEKEKKGVGADVKLGSHTFTQNMDVTFDLNIL